MPEINRTEERKALRISAGLMAVMAVSGLALAIASHSQAIMLDGVFSTIGFAMALVTLKVAELVKRPDDDHFQFGYAHFTPLLNVVKSLVMVVMCVFAAASAVETFFVGGRELQLDWALAYGVVATVSCALAAVFLRRAAKKTGSVLVEVDAVTWLVDTAISSAVLIGFLIGFLIEGTQFETYGAYVDPAIVIALVLIAIPEPSKILVTSLRESLLFAPPKGYRQRLREIVDKTMQKLPVEEYRVRQLKLGDTVNVMIHVQPSADFELGGFESLDVVRRLVQADLDQLPERIILDVIFVADFSLAD